MKYLFILLLSCHKEVEPMPCKAGIIISRGKETNIVEWLNTECHYDKDSDVVCKKFGYVLYIKKKSINYNGLEMDAEITRTKEYVSFDNYLYFGNVKF